MPIGVLQRSCKCNQLSGLDAANDPPHDECDLRRQVILRRKSDRRNTDAGFGDAVQPCPGDPGTAWNIPDPPTPVRAMGDNVTPGIEVATIKPSRPDARGGGVTIGDSGVLTATNAPLNLLIAMAYGVDQRQLSGAPSWVESDNFDITIKPDHEGVPDQGQVRVVASPAGRSLRLKAHIEKKEQPAYALAVVKSGLKMTKVDPPRGDHPGFGLGPANLRVNNATMAEFANVLSHVVGRPVVDRTGIEGRYDCLLQFLPSPAGAAQLPPNEQPPEGTAP